MVTRRRYTDRDKAIVYAELAVNDGNIKRSARNTGYDISFVRRSKAEWERNGVPDSVMEEVAPLVSDFMLDAIRIRGKLLIRLEEILDKGEKATIPQVSTAIGILSDKIRAYEAIKESTKVTHTFELPSGEELKELFSGVLAGVVESARSRAAEIEAIEEPLSTTYRELPVAKEE